MNALLASLQSGIDRLVPACDDEADDRRARFIAVVCLGTIPPCVIGAAHEFYVDNSIGVAINVATVATNVIGLELVRRGSGRAAGWLLVLFQLFAANLAAAGVGGPASSGFAGNTVVLIFAAIVLPRYAVVLVLAVMVALAAAMIQFPTPVVEFSPGMHVWTWAVCLTLAGGMVAALVSVTEGLLVRANQKSDALEHAMGTLRETSVSRDFVQGVLSALPEFVIVTDIDGRIVMVNQALETAGYVPHEALVGRALGDVITGIAPQLGSSEALLVTAAGDTIPVAVSRGALPVQNGDDRALLVWSATDIRAQHATADALRQAHHRAQSASIAKSNFLANMSHELRTPLNAIIGYGELLGEEISDPAQRNDLDRIGGAARTLLDLINGVLDLSRIESGKVELQYATTPLAQIVEPVLHLIAPLASARGLQVVASELALDGPDVYTDAGKLRQVITNLLTNAVKFTASGTVELSVTRWQRSGLDWLRLVVSDTGIGMASEHLEHVFEPFAQVNDNKTSEFGGTGLGLSITSAFVEMMGGQIYAESEVGVGTRFVVELPAAQHTRVSVTPSRRNVLPEAQASAQTVLVVDDDEHFLELVHRVLASDGRQVVCTSNPGAGLEWARTQRADLILLDVAMPSISGWQFLVRLRDGASATSPVFVVSGDGDPTVATALGAKAFLTKPVVNNDLRAAVDGELAAAPPRPTPDA